jgi:hypothetical protein
MSKTPHLPVVNPTGDMLPYMSAARRLRALDTVFEMIGGEERLAHEASKDSEGFWNFAKLWAKGPLPVSQNNTSHSVDGKSVEDLWEKLDKRKREADLGVIHDNSIIEIDLESPPDAD